MIFVNLALQLKNFLYTREESLKQAYQERWLTIPEDIRAHIKSNVKKSNDLSIRLIDFVYSSVLTLSELKQKNPLKLLNALAT